MNAARSFIFETALAPPTLAAALAALEILEKEPGRSEQLERNVARVGEGLARLGFEVRAARRRRFSRSFWAITAGRCAPPRRCGVRATG
jgi:7-keto-8-aminopelargonate synthetase-like enzyme